MVSVALTRQSLGIASEFNAFQGYEVHLTEDGGVATGPSAASTLVTRVVPVLGEARFSSFNISPSFPGLHGFAPSPVRWPYIMGEQTGFVNEVRRLNLTDSTTSSATASFGVGSIIAASATRPGISYGYLLRFSQEVRRWDVADETNASTGVVVANAGREFESVRLDAAGNIWLGGDFQGYIQKRDEDGDLIFEVQVPGGPGSSDRYSNFVVPDGIDGALVLNQDNDGGSNYSQWLLVDGSGNVTDVTDSVTVDGQAWASEITAAFGGPGVMIGSYGNRICFNPEGAAGSGTDLLFGIVTDTPAGTGWTVGRVRWPLAPLEPHDFDLRHFSGGDGLEIEIPDGDGYVAGMILIDRTVFPGDGNPAGNFLDLAGGTTGNTPIHGAWRPADYGQGVVVSSDGTTASFGVYFCLPRSDPRLTTPVTNGADKFMEGWTINVPFTDPEYRLFDDINTPIALSTASDVYVTFDVLADSVSTFDEMTPTIDVPWTDSEGYTVRLRAYDWRTSGEPTDTLTVSGEDSLILAFRETST